MKRKIVSIVLSIVLLFSVSPIYADNEGNITYVAFTSDVHNGADNINQSSAKVLNDWIIGVAAKLDGITFDSFGFCGDYGNAGAITSNYWKYSMRVYEVVNNNKSIVKNAFYILGNHEFDPGSYLSNSNEFISHFQTNGSTYISTNESYILYAFGASGFDANKNGFTTADINNLKAFLQDPSTPNNTPIFILSHFPLHIYAERESKNRTTVINLLNEASDNHNIFFVWGHNHSHNDPKYDRVYVSGSKLDNLEYKFTYLAAGSMSDSKTNQYGGNVAAKGLVAAIDGDNNVTLTYYKQDLTAFGATQIKAPQPNLMSYYAEYVNGQMTVLNEIKNQTLQNAQNGIFTFNIPQSDADERKLFFVDEYWQPKATFIF